MKWLQRNWLYILAFTLPFERIPSLDVMVGSHAVTLKISFVIALLVSLAAAVQLARQRRLKLFRPDWWLAGYGVVMVISAALAENRGRALQVIAATGLVIILALVIERTLPKFDLTKVYKVLMAAAVIMGFIGMYQFIADSFGVPAAFTGLKHIYTKAIFGFPRIQATALEPLYLASFLLLPVSLMVARLYVRVSNWKSYVILAFLAMIIALTLSRGGIYASLAAMAMAFVALRGLGSPRRLLAIMAAGAAGAGAAIGLVYITTHLTSAPSNAVGRYLTQTTHLTSGAGSADSDRTVNRRLALNAFYAHPVFGIGVGNFGTYAHEHDASYAHNSSAIVNNEYLEILAETGIAGLLMLAGFAITVLIQVRRAWRRTLSEGRIWLAGLMAFFVGTAIQYYSFSTLYIDHIWFAIGLLLGLLAAANYTARLDRRRPAPANETD